MIGHDETALATSKLGEPATYAGVLVVSAIVALAVIRIVFEHK